MVAEKLIGNKIRPRTVIMKLYIESVMSSSLRDREVSTLCRVRWEFLNVRCVRFVFVMFAFFLNRNRAFQAGSNISKLSNSKCSQMSENKQYFALLFLL